MHGMGRVFDRPAGSGKNWAIGYYVRGQECRESVARLLGKPPGNVTRRDAERCLKGRLGEIANGRFVGPEQERLTVGEILDRYLEAKRVEGRKSLVSIDTHCLRCKEVFGDVRAVALTTSMIQDWIADRLRAEYARGTVKVWAAYLRAALRWAWKSELLARVPHVPSLRVDNARRGFFEREEFERVVALLPKPVDDIAWFAYLTGWRKQEILGLTWAMVDRQRRQIRLPDSKNDEGRVLPLVGELWKLLERRWAARVVGDRLSEWVFHRHGHPVRDIKHVWRRACQEAGVPGRYLHDCRRTAARDMVAAGVSPYEAMQVTGHRSLAMFERYNIKTTREAAKALTAREQLLRAEQG
jgi:integrase